MEPLTVSPEVQVKKNFDLSNMVFLASLFTLPIIWVIYYIIKPDPITNLKDWIPFALASAPFLIIILYTLLNNLKQGKKVDFMRPLLPEVYVKKILYHNQEMAKYNPEIYGRAVYIGHEGNPEDPDGGTIPRKVLWLFAPYSEKLGEFDYENPIRYGLTAEHDFYVVGTQPNYKGVNKLFVNKFGMRRMASMLPTTKTYTKVIKEEAGRTITPEVDEEVEESEE